MAETPDEVLLKDITTFIDVGLITNSESIAFALAILYNSLDEKDKKDLVAKTCEVSKMINEFFAESVADRPGSSVSFMFALLYMLANLNGTMMFDEHWLKLVQKGLECRASVISTMTNRPGAKPGSKVDENRGYC
jgi:hypothetical protein